MLYSRYGTDDFPMSESAPRDPRRPKADDPRDANATPIESVLLTRMRAGDTSAFETFFRRYYDGLYRFAFDILGRRELAEEVVQDVFARIWVRRTEWVVTGTVQNYLYGAVRNGAIALIRHGRHERSHAEGVRAVPAPRSAAFATPDRIAERHELRDALHAAILELPERTREAFLLNRQHNLSYPEVAAVMQISVKGVEYHIGAALRLLRIRLAPFMAGALFLVMGRF